MTISRAAAVGTIALLVTCILVAESQGTTTVAITNSLVNDGNTPPTDWTDENGGTGGTTSPRSFTSSGRGAMIGVNALDPFLAGHVTSTAVVANTTYLLEFNNGFFASNAREGDWEATLGTDSGGTFTALGANSGTLTQTAANEFRFSDDRVQYNSTQVTTGAAVSGNNLAIQLGADDTTSGDTNQDFLGFDNVYLSAFAPNEIIIRNHSFDMSDSNAASSASDRRDNNGGSSGVDADNMMQWTEVSGSTASDEARGFTGGGFRAAIGMQATDTFTLEQVLDATIAPGTEYTLSVDIGFMQSGAGVTGDYLIELGTSNGGVFTALATLDSMLTQTVVSEFNISAGNATTVDLVLGTGAVVSGDNLAIRLTKEDATTFFGFDKVELTAVPFVPEPASLILAICGMIGFTALVRQRPCR